MCDRILSSVDFLRDVPSVLASTISGPVFLTEDGRIAHVLLSANQYRHLEAGQQGIVDLLAMPIFCGVYFGLLRADGIQVKPIDFG